MKRSVLHILPTYGYQTSILYNPRSDVLWASNRSSFSVGKSPKLRLFLSSVQRYFPDPSLPQVKKNYKSGL